MGKLDENLNPAISEMPAGKTLDVVDFTDLKFKVPDVKTFGDHDAFKLLCKASSEEQGWMKSTKVCNVPYGCIVQVSTLLSNPDGSYSVAEALCYVPDTQINTDKNIPRLMTTR
jgi:hypothetical protein